MAVLETRDNFGNPLAPIDVYIDHIADDTLSETDNDKFHGDLYAASRDIGLACVALAGGHVGDSHWADEVLESVRSQLQSYSRNLKGMLTRPQARLLVNTVDTVLERDDTNRVRDMQHEEHRIAIGSLENIIRYMERPRQPEAYAKAIGTASELTLIGLLTPPSDDRSLAMPALPHQNMRRNGYESNSSNFDACVISPGESLPSRFPALWESEEGALEARKIQVKSACFGECRPEDEWTYRDEISYDRFIRFRETYDPDITLISGCCDLGLQRLHGGSHDLSTARALVAGLRDASSASQDARIKELREGLLQTIVSDKNRRGLVLTPSMSDRY